MFNLERITCPKCEAKIHEDMQADNIDIIQSAFQNTHVKFKCYKCDYIITAHPDVVVTYDDIK